MPIAAAGAYMFDEWEATPIQEGISSSEPVTVPGRPADFASAEGVTYRATFDDPRDEGDDVAILELRGLYAHAEVEVTGTRLRGDWPVTHDAYFVPLRIPFIPAEEEGNDVVVTCHEPRDRFGGIHDSDLVPEESAVPGIWWDVSLSASPLPYVESIDVEPTVEDESATLDVRTTVVTDEPMEAAVTYSVKPEGDVQASGMMQRGTVEAKGPGRTTVEHEVGVRDPALWWPRGYGDQSRYTLRAKFEGTERTVTTGIRDVRFEDGSLYVNDERVPIRGVNLLTSDPEDVERARDLNANLVRAHGQVLPAEFYDRCDREGLLVWQDLPLTGPGEFGVDRGQTLATELSRTLARHPSVAAYAVHDDPVASFADGLGSGLLAGLRMRWRSWRTSYDPTPAERVASSLPDELPVFPVVGGPGVAGDAASYYPGWEYGTADSIASLLDRYPASIVAEFGAGSIPSDDAVEDDPDEDASDDDLDDDAGDDDPAEDAGDHDSAEDAGGQAEDFSDVAGFDAALHDRRVGDDGDSQTYQANLLRRVAEYLRRDGVGAIPFCLRDTDRAGMGVYARDGTPKPAAEAVRVTFAPLQAFLGDGGGSNEVVILNDIPRSLTASLEWEAGDETGSTSVEIPDRDRLEPEPLDIPGDAESVTLRLVTDHGTVENEYER